MGEVCRIPDGLECCLGQRMVLLRIDRKKIDGEFLLYALQSPTVQEQIRWNEGAGSTVSNLRIPVLEALVISVPEPPEQRAIARILVALDAKLELNRKTNETLEAMARALFKSWFVDFDPVRAKAEGRTPSGMDAETAKLFPSELVESELGLIPKGWRVGSVGDLVTLKRGTTYKGALVGHPGPALLGLGSIKPGGGFRSSGFKTYGGECPPELMLQPGDMYVSLKGATKDGEMIGSIARVPRSVSSGRLTQDTVRLELREPVFATALYRLLLTPEYRVYCAGRAMGSAVVALSRDDFLAYPAILPPLPVLERFNTVVQGLEERGERNDAQTEALSQLRDTLLPRLLSGEVSVASAVREAEGVA